MNTDAQHSPIERRTMVFPNLSMSAPAVAWPEPRSISVAKTTRRPRVEGGFPSTPQAPNSFEASSTAGRDLVFSISPHSLRHSFITAALDAGVPLRDAREAASHADPRTTMRYDRARRSLDRHATYIVSTFIAGATRPA